MAKTEKYTAAPLLEREQIEQQIKPLSNNGFVRFFQNIGRGWLKTWYNWQDKQPGLTKILYMLFFFVIFSQAVTVFQLLGFIFLPAAIGEGMANTHWLLPSIEMGYAIIRIPAYELIAGEWVRISAYGRVYGDVLNLEHVGTLVAANARAAANPSAGAYMVVQEMQYFAILGSPLNSVYRQGYTVLRTAVQDGSPIGSITNPMGVIGGGLGYFIALAVMIFLAQVINFPLQRNITFRSKGNVAYQIMWYFIGWVLIQPFVFAIGSLWRAGVNLVIGATVPGILMPILDMVVTGGVSMAIFFFIFLIIFPNRDKVAQKAKSKLEAAKKGGNQEQIAALEAKYRDADIRARYANADKAAHKTKAQASGRALSYFASEKTYEKTKARLEAAKAEGGAKLASAQLAYANAKYNVPLKHQAVSDASVAKEKAAANYEQVTAEFESYKQELGLAK